MTVKVVAMKSTGSHPIDCDRRAGQLYTAASSLFALPDYQQVLAHLRGNGPVPEAPECVKDPASHYAIGIMSRPDRPKDESYVRIVTAGGRAVEVRDGQTVVYFRTGQREASAEAAKQVLEHLHLHTGDEVCLLELTDGRHVSDADIAPEDIHHVEGVLV